MAQNAALARSSAIAGLSVADRRAMGRRRDDGRHPRQVPGCRHACRRICRREQTHAAVVAADAAFRASARSHERGAILDRAAAQIEKRAPEFVEVPVQKPASRGATPPGNPALRGHLRLSAEEARAMRRRDPDRGRVGAEGSPRLHIARAARNSLRHHAVQCAAEHGRPLRSVRRWRPETPSF